MKTADAARGKWRGILMALGVDSQYLNGKHGPCPICQGGKDRFRWDNQHGDGGFFCSVCKAGNGFDLLMQVKGWDFRTCAQEIDKIVGNVSAEPVRQKIDDSRRVDMLNRLWKASSPLQDGDPAAAYLAGRVSLPKALPKCLRFAADCPMPEGKTIPALLAMVTTIDGAPANIHRTAIHTYDGAKRSRAMMPGEIPEGAAVRLFPVHGNRLGIAEGIETAFAAAQRFNVPVWSAINSTMLTKWMPPAGVEEVLIFGDCDPKFGGQAAAYQLAHRLAARHRLAVQVHIPGQMGLDWADSDAA